MNPVRSIFLPVIVLASLVATAQRLPDVATPENYRITLTPNFTTDKFAGDEIIRVRVLKPTDAIVLNAFQIDFQSASISAGGAEQVAKVTLDPKSQIATLALSKPIAAGPADIHIRSTGTLNNDLRGQYLSKANGAEYA